MLDTMYEFTMKLMEWGLKTTVALFPLYIIVFIFLFLDGNY